MRIDWKRFYGEPDVDPLALEAVFRFGEFIERRRHDLGMTQHHLARTAGVSQSTISRIERGLMPYATLAVVARIARPLLPR